MSSTRYKILGEKRIKDLGKEKGTPSLCRILVARRKLICAHDRLRPLNIKYLKTAYDDTVRMNQRVGDLFKDRSPGDKDLRDSIVYVHRYPPTKHELESAQRFSSLAPESSARPRKRLVGEPLQAHRQQDSQSGLQPIASIEGWGAHQPEESHWIPNKRQRRQEFMLRSSFDLHPSLASLARGDEVFHSSQTTGTQGTITQVYGSQKSPGRKSTTFHPPTHNELTATIFADPNPYGTPISLSLISPQEPTVGSQIDISTIPDSPPSRGATLVNGRVGATLDLDREDTQSESPELLASVHELAPMDPANEQHASVPASGKEFEPSSISLDPLLTRPPRSIQELVDEYTNTHGLKGLRGNRNTAKAVDSSTKRTTPSIDTSGGQVSQDGNALPHRLEHLNDPIESDIGISNEAQGAQCEARTSDLSRLNCHSASDGEPGDEQRLNQNETKFQQPNDDLLAQDRERLEKEAEEQREKKGARDSKPEERRLAQVKLEKEKAAERRLQEQRKDEEAKQAAAEQSAERKAQELRLAEEKRASEEERAQQVEVKEKELALAKRIEETRASENWLAEETKAREQSLREKKLVEEADKMMLAAAGAKQLEAEKLAKKARRQELTAEKKANAEKAGKAKTQNQLQEQKAQGSGRLRGEQQAREEAQKPPESSSRSAKQDCQETRPSQAGTKASMKHGQEKSKGRNVQKLRNSTEPTGRAWSTPEAPHPLAQKRTMTPQLPGSSDTKSNSSVQGSETLSSPLGPRSSRQMHAPLRSALRQTPGALRRSVSFADDVTSLSRLDYAPNASPSKSHVKILNDLAAEPSSASKPSKTLPSQTPPSQTPIPRKATASKVIKTHAVRRRGKIQTKLVVTRDKKMKGRAVDSPAPSKSVPQQEIVLSSDDEDTVYTLSDEEAEHCQTGHAKAGPSSRKHTLVLKSSRRRQFNPRATPINPAIHQPKAEQDRNATPTLVAGTTSRPSQSSRNKSTSRSPARPLSESISLSFGSDPGSDQESDSESQSDSVDEAQNDSSKNPSGTKSGRLAPANNKSAAKVVTVESKMSKPSSNGTSSSRASQAPLSRASTAAMTNGNGKHVDQAADNQLQRESRQSVSTAHPLKSPSTIDVAADNKNTPILNQGLSLDGRLANGIRPANYRYPRLTDIKKLAAAPPTAKRDPDKIETSGSLRAPAALDAVSSSSSSDDDDSSSNSEDDKDLNGDASQSSSKTTSGIMSGVRGLLKSRCTAPRHFLTCADILKSPGISILISNGG